MSKTCFFIGHRDVPPNIFPILKEAVEKHIVDYGIMEFIVGMYGDFDRMAARAVREEKHCYPEIKLTLLLPYHPAEFKTELCADYDDLYYPSGMENTPRRYAIVKANRKVINNVDYLIAYVTHPASNAIKFLQYARRLEKNEKLTITSLGSL